MANNIVARFAPCSVTQPATSILVSMFLYILVY